MKPSDSDWACSSQSKAWMHTKSFLPLNAPLPPLTLVFVIMLSLNLKGREEMTPSVVSFIHVEVPVLIFFSPTVRFSQISAAWRDGVTARLFLLPPRFRGVFKFDFADNFKVANPPPPSTLHSNPSIPPPNRLLCFDSFLNVTSFLWLGFSPCCLPRLKRAVSSFILWRPN